MGIMWKYLTLYIFNYYILMSYPKHKPTFLDERTPWARDDLYAGNFDANGKMTNWEGIEAARKRQGKSTMSPEQVVKQILTRLYERLRVANWSTDHRDPYTGNQVRVDPKITKNLIWQLVQVTRWIKSDELRYAVGRQVSEIRQGFKNAQ